MAIQPNKLIETLLLRRLYEAERKLSERNYAKDHSFDEWVARLTC